ncbi:MAG: hypothetical protein AAF495_22485 [Pseudomonadota bacterium]
MKSRSTLAAKIDTRSIVIAMAATTALAMSLLGGVVQADSSGLSDPGLEIDQSRTVLVDGPRSDLLSPSGDTKSAVN